jgi:GNAT superfamily N-acetyltransferase
VESLDNYLKTQASQDMRRKANAVFVLVPERAPGTIAGYFTLCACGLAPGTIPEEASKHLPRYPQVSATLLGRLAVTVELQGRGLGSVLLAEALRKAYGNAAVVGSSMVVVDAGRGVLPGAWVHTIAGVNAADIADADDWGISGGERLLAHCSVGLAPILISPFIPLHQGSANAKFKISSTRSHESVF